MITDMLLPFQSSVLRSCRGKERLGLFLDMGLGKTPLSIAFMEDAQVSNLIIVTINAKATESESVKGSFLDWVSKSSLASYARYSKKDKAVTQPSKNVLIINYESLFKRGVGVELSPILMSFVRSTVGSVGIILDESHRIKSSSSMAYKSVSKLISLLEAKGRLAKLLLCTGTPFTASYLDLYTQLKLLGLEMTKNAFLDRFCVRGEIPGLMSYQQPIVGYKDLDLLYKIVNRYAVTIKSDEVISLPPQVFSYITIPPESSPDHFALFVRERMPYKDICLRAKELKIPAPEKGKGNFQDNPFYRNLRYPDPSCLSETASSAFMRARMVSIGFFQGADGIPEWVDERRLERLRRLLSDQPTDYVIFYNFNAELFALYDMCESLGYDIDVWCGEIKSSAFYDKYKPGDPGKRVMLCNFASGSTGLNLQKYSHTVFFSLPVFRDWEQALKRTHRIGQGETAFYYVFSSDNWLDKNMLESLKEKRQYDERLFMEGMKISNSKEER